MTNTTRRISACISLLAAGLVLAGCGGNAPYSPIIADAGSDFVLTVENPSVTVEHNARADFRLNLRAVGSFSAPVQFSVDHQTIDWEVLPSSKVTPTPSGTPVTLVVYTGRNLPGNFTFTASATGGGVTRRVTLNLKVTGLSISVEPRLRTLVPGGTAEYIVTVTPVNGHTLSATLEAGGLPSGVVASFEPATVQFVGTAPRTSRLVLSLPQGGDRTSQRNGGSEHTFTVTATSGRATVSTEAAVLIQASGGIDATIR